MTLSPLVINDLHPRSRPVSVSRRDREYHSSPSPARASACVCVCVCVSVDKKSVLPDYIIVEEGERGREGPMDEKGGREIPLTAMVARMVWRRDIARRQPSRFTEKC